MYFSAHQVADGVINQAVAGDRVLAGKGGGDDVQHEVAAVFRTGMAGVTMRLVFDNERIRSQYGEALAQQFRRAHAGRAFLNGLTTTLA